MSFRPARFADIHRSGPPTTGNGMEWTDGGRWAVNVQFVEERIHRANDDYRRWLDEAHRKGDERRQDERTEADRVRDLNERFRDL